MQHAFSIRYVLWLTMLLVIIAAWIGSYALRAGAQ